MRWIQLWSPFVHSSFGCGAIAKTLKTRRWNFALKRTDFHPTVDQVPTTIRMSWRVVSGPIRCAESSCGIHFPIAPLVEELQPKRSQVKILPDRSWCVCVPCVWVIGTNVCKHQRDSEKINKLIEFINLPKHTIVVLEIGKEQNVLELCQIHRMFPNVTKCSLFG